MKRMLRLQLLVVLAALVGACAQPTTPQPAVLPSATVSVTLDACAPENLPDEVKKVNDLMREFDDASAVASSTPMENLGSSISELQRIRRAAEDQQVPACLGTLKQYQLDHMNLVINTMLAFMNGSEESTVNDGINRARAAHDLFAREVAALLGITLVPVTATTLPPPVGTATPTLAPTLTP